MRKLLYLLVFLLMLLFQFHCFGPKDTLHIISGSENKSLEPLLKEFESQTGIHVKMKYKGSVDIMMELNNPEFHYDAVWPANSLWISIGDQRRIVKHTKSIMTSPVVFGIKKSLAKKLGFINKEVKVNDILNAVINKKLRFMMTSATQSNSGSSAYLGFVYALLGHPDVITKKSLYNPELKKKFRKLFQGINRSSGSSGWLKELFLKGNYDAMVNYEALIIEANQELIRQGKEPLYVVYPVDGLVIADSPLGYVKQQDYPEREESFKKLQAFLLSKEIQEKILDLGRRTGLGGTIENGNPDIFRAEWGIDTKRVISPIPLPPADVIFEALNLYQTEFRKPSFTVFCLDYSGSMASSGIDELKSGMQLLLNETEARRYLIQSGSEDKFIIIPFNRGIIDVWKSEGNTRNGLNALLNKIFELQPGGGTDIYSPVIEGIKLLNQEKNLYDYVPAIILLTDGRSNTYDIQGLTQVWNEIGNDVPVFSILFGKADKDQLHEIVDLTRGKIFDGRNDLIKAFRKAKGYN